ncbi:lytic transglycosylase domain-containing protein [Methylocystis sp. IM3]|uniref:lytic transglycosylase domain-containing protein n=1 Tax=unclassified Methylocystis TaxID=2625913 RepID=UPI0030F66CE4
MRGPALGIVLACVTGPQALAGEAAMIARGRALEAVVSPSGKVVPAPVAGSEVERATEGGAKKTESCPGPGPMPASAARDLVERIAHEENFYPDFVSAVARAESRFQSDAVSPRGAIGLMQLEPETAKHYGVNICDPADNVRGGVRFLRDLHSRYRNPLFILAAYNAGEKALVEHGGIPPFPETVNFVAAVVNDFYDWPKIDGKTRDDRGSGAAPPQIESAKDHNWRSGFVWNLEQNGEQE